MTKVEFLAQLEALLKNASPDERVAALQYYGEYLDEAGPENEAGVIAELGGPDKVAADILSGGGTGDAPFAPPRPAPEKPAAAKAAPRKNPFAESEPPRPAPLPIVVDEPTRQNPPPNPASSGYNQRNNRIAVIILLVFLGIFIIPILAGLGGVLIGLLVAMIVLFLCPIILGVALLVAGIVTIVTGALAVGLSLGTGLVAIGAGVLLVGLGLMCLYGGGKLLGKTLPGIIRGTVNGIASLLRSISNKFGFGKEVNHG